MVGLNGKKMAVLAALLLSGCSHATYPATAQPRALVWGIAQPYCAAICIAHVTVTDSEKGTANTTVTSTDTVSTPILNGLKALP